MGRSQNEKSVRVRRAVKGRGFLFPKYSSAARRFMIAVGGAYLRWVEGVSRISVYNEDVIIDAMQKFHNSEHRLIFTFRHPAEEDPPVLMTTFNKVLRKQIEKNGKSSHIRFLYGRDVTNWAGSAAVWLFPRIGAVPVQNRGGNSKALNILRREMTDGIFPIALAPEEQVVYHMYRTSELAPGVSSLVRWGLESGRPVTVVPIATGYRYGKDPQKFIRLMLSRWEGQTGIKLSTHTDTAGSQDGDLYPLLIEAAERTIGLLEQFYGISPAPETERLNPHKIDFRIESLCNVILTAAEKTADLPSEGNIIERLFRIRYTGVDAFYPEHTDPALEPLMKRAFLDFKALESEVSIRHSQIVDVLEYIRTSYIAPPFSSGRGCEFILNLLDVINRVNGGNINGHPTPDNQHAAVYAGTPVVFNPEQKQPKGRREYLDYIRNEVKNALVKTSAELESAWEKIKLE